MRIKELYNSAVRRLVAADISDPQLEVAVLLGHILDMDRAQLFLAAEQDVPRPQIDSFENFLQRRLHREPTAYILGECEFWSLPFRVTQDVLIPRPETEFLLEMTLQKVRSGKDVSPGPVLDLCTGSGVIAIVLALEMEQWPEIYGTDYSVQALRVAQANAVMHGVAERVRYINSDLFSAFGPGARFGLIVSNPPYVEQEMIKTGDKGATAVLQPEIVEHEPHLALDGGKQGLEVIERIAAGIPGVLKPGGWFFMEIGAGQAEFVMELFQALSCFDAMHIYHDYGGQPRIFQARRQGVGFASSKVKVAYG
jgi:release factor glutamine methyltransferase